VAFPWLWTIAMASSLPVVAQWMVRPVQKLKGCFVEHHCYTKVHHNKKGAQTKELLWCGRATFTSTILRTRFAMLSCSSVEQTHHQLSRIHEWCPFSDAGLVSLESATLNTSRTGRTHIAVGTNKEPVHCMANTCARPSNGHNRGPKRLCSFQALQHTLQSQRRRWLVLQLLSLIQALTLALTLALTQVPTLARTQAQAQEILALSSVEPMWTQSCSSRWSHHNNPTWSGNASASHKAGQNNP